MHVIWAPLGALAAIGLVAIVLEAGPTQLERKAARCSGVDALELHRDNLIAAHALHRSVQDIRRETFERHCAR